MKLDRKVKKGWGDKWPEREAKFLLFQKYFRIDARQKTCVTSRQIAWSAAGKMANINNLTSPLFAVTKVTSSYPSFNWTTWHDFRPLQTWFYSRLGQTFIPMINKLYTVSLAWQPYIILEKLTFKRRDVSSSILWNTYDKESMIVLSVAFFCFTNK